MNRELTIRTLPKHLLDEAGEMLRGEDTEVYVIRWNGRMRVVGKVFPYEHSWDEKLLLTIREADLFTDEERTENYINYFHKYPAWYKGKRDEAMLARMTPGHGLRPEDPDLPRALRQDGGRRLRVHGRDAGHQTGVGGGKESPGGGLY